MNISRTFLIIGLVCIALGTVLIMRKMTKQTTTTQYTIGILQTATHEALNNARDGFMHTMQEKMGNSVSFIIKNGEGSIQTLQTLAQQLSSDVTYSAFFAIATPAAKALAEYETQRPLFVTAVSDPDAAGITGHTNVCGVTDMLDYQNLVDIFVTLLPTAKRVTLIYNYAEQNSVAQVAQLTALLKKHAIETIAVGITHHADISAGLTRALRTSDAVLAPTDNLVASSITLIAQLCDAAHKPLIVSDNLLLRYGALMSAGVDYTTLGKQTGLMAYDILVQHTSPENAGIVNPSSEIHINQQKLEQFRLTAPSNQIIHITNPS